jgi:hypothetical protein
MVRNQGRVTRFVVMAVLQAARAESLGVAHDSALSWGLNRAIFYAAAKRGFKQPSALKDGDSSETASRPAPPVYCVGDEEAYVDPSAKHLTFTIGGQDQTPAAFERQVASRFGTKENFMAAWKEAMNLVAGFDRSALKSRRGFYEEVYRPKRDELSDRWTERYSPAPKPT